MGAMAATAAGTDDAALAAEEARLARAATAGDGSAFAELYERYARRAYNLAYRLTGSEQDAADATQEAFVGVMRRLPELGGRELSFGSYLLTATRNAAYDLLAARQRTEASDSIPEAAVPLGAGAGGLGLDPGDPEEDPDRRLLLSAQQEEIRAANGRLPERQREALALRELEGLSYDEIAAVMGMNRNSVAQLISRARIKLRDELRGTALASIAASSPGCERALPLIAVRDDGQLDPASADAAWLASHLAACETCPLAAEAMQEAGASYRLWVPLAIAPALFEETMARAAELTGSDWGEATASRLAAPADPETIPGLPPAYRDGAGAGGRGGRRRAVAAAVLGAVVLLLGGAALLLAGGDGEPAPPVAQPADETKGAADGGAERGPGPGPKRERRPAGVSRENARSQPADEGPAPAQEALADAPPSPAASGEGAGDAKPPSSPQPPAGSVEPGTAGLEPSQQTAKQQPPEPSEPPPTPTPEPTPPATTPPTTTTPPPVEEPPVEQPPAEEPPPREPPGRTPPAVP